MNPLILIASGGQSAGGGGGYTIAGSGSTILNTHYSPDGTVAGKDRWKHDSEDIWIAADATGGWQITPLSAPTVPFPSYFYESIQGSLPSTNPSDWTAGSEGTPPPFTSLTAD